MDDGPFAQFPKVTLAIRSEKDNEGNVDRRRRGGTLLPVLKCGRNNDLSE